MILVTHFLLVMILVTSFLLVMILVTHFYMMALPFFGDLTVGKTNNQTSKALSPDGPLPDDRPVASRAALPAPLRVSKRFTRNHRSKGR